MLYCSAESPRTHENVFYMFWYGSLRVWHSIIRPPLHSASRDHIFRTSTLPHWKFSCLQITLWSVRHPLEQVLLQLLVFGVDDNRQGNESKLNKANCFVWKINVAAGMERNWRACVYSKIWTATFETADMFDEWARCVMSGCLSCEGSKCYVSRPWIKIVTRQKQNEVHRSNPETKHYIGISNHTH